MEDNVWLGEVLNGNMDKFDPSLTFLETVEPKFESVEVEKGTTPPRSLAINYASEQFLVTGQSTREFLPPHVDIFSRGGAFLNRSVTFGGIASVAVDNSTDALDPSRCVLSVCTVYVVHNTTNPGTPFGDGQPQGIEKFSINESGEMSPAPFAGTAAYIEGNEIVGAPNSSVASESFSSDIYPAPTSVSVDSSGNVYAWDADFNSSQSKKPEGAIVEFNPEGLFVRAFTAEENPGLGEHRVGWGTCNSQCVHGVAVDSLSERVLVSMISEDGEEGVIDEFDLVSGRFEGQITEAEVEVSPGVRRLQKLRNPQAMAVSSTGELFAVDGAEKALDAYGVHRTLPSVALAVASERKRTEATVNGSVNPNEQKLTDCHFEYVTEEAYLQNISEHGNEEREGFTDLSSGGTVPCVPSAAEIAANATSQPVAAHLGGLDPGMTYRYRLVAATEGALGGTEVTASLAFTTPSAPTIEEAFATNISSNYVDLHAVVNPRGAATSYHFEYDTVGYTGADRHGASIPVPDDDVGSGGATGSVSVSVVQQVGGLTPGVGYHFRVVAENEVEGVIETTYGPDDTFGTLPPAIEDLPDNRAFEMLTPSNKGSAEDMFAQPVAEVNAFANGDVGYPSESGNEFLLTTKAGFGSFSASATNGYVFRRSESGVTAGWSTLPLASPLLGVQGTSIGAFDPGDLSRLSISDIVGSQPSVNGVQYLGLAGPPGGPYKTLLTSGEAGNSEIIVGASRDLSRVIVETIDPTVLPEGQYQGSHALYEWSEGGECSLSSSNCGMVSVRPDGKPFECGAQLGLSVSRHGAVSADGSRIFFTAPDPSTRNPDPGKGCWDETTGENAPELYMRASGQTIEVSAPEEGVLENGHQPILRPAVYVGASDDGRRVFFVTETELTSDAALLKLHDPELYEYNVDAAKVTRISAGELGESEARIFAVPAISADGSTVYFATFGSLTQGVPVQSSAGSSGPVNLYRYDAASQTTRYVASFERRDYPGSASGWWAHALGTSQELALAKDANWYTTPDGRYLVFGTSTELTDYSTTEGGVRQCPLLDVQQKTQSGHCIEVYRYDAQAAAEGGVSIACVSCDRNGAKPMSDAFFAHGADLAAPSVGPVRAMSDNGGCIFFDSADPLVPQATNGTNNVYEWEAPGMSECEPVSEGGCSVAEGCVSLLSSGVETFPSFFLGASVDGRNVFLGTHARLVPQDTDHAGDLYDVRVGGGIAPPRGRPPCEGDACQNPPAASVDATPSSLVFAGAGNIGEARPTPKSLTNAQKLVRSLKACRHASKSKKKRKRCERTARRRYATKKRSAKGGQR